MKTILGKSCFPRERNRVFLLALLIVGLLFSWLPAIHALSGIAPGGGGGHSSPVPLDSWSFRDNVNWTSDSGYVPASFTNLGYSYLGDGASLVVNSTNQAWLQYNVWETNGATNLTVDIGSVEFWFAPNWASTNQGGFGPGEWGRLIEVGGYSPDSSYAWWSLCVDDVGQNLYFFAQTNDLSGTLTTYLSAPISWTTNYWHHIVLTYSATNTALYLDGVMATSGPPVTVFPGPDVLTNGFFMGSDSNGLLQAQGMFNSVATYNVPLDANLIQSKFVRGFGLYLMNPWNSFYMSALTSARSTPAYNSTYDVISGQGSLQLVGEASSCSDGTTANQIWITNVTATAASSTSMNVTFTIEGGVAGVPYDVFANSVLSFGPNGVPWAWMGQGYQCHVYTLTNLPNLACFLILGTPQDSSNDGLTDAYEQLVMKIDPAGPQFDSYGVPYAWYAEYGILTTGATQDPDQDGLLNYQEYRNGTKPMVSEGFNIWISTPNATTGIP